MDEQPLDSIPLALAIPSRGNPDGLRHCVNSAIALANHPERISVHLHLSDDATTARFLPPWPNEESRLRSKERRHYYAEANELFRSLPDGYFVWTDDDSEFVMPGWDDTLLSLRSDAPVIEFFPGEMKHFLSHTDVFRSRFGGLLYPEGFVHFCGDSARAHDLRGEIARLDSDDPARAILSHPMMANRSPGMLAVREKFWEQDCSFLRHYVLGRPP